MSTNPTAPRLALRLARRELARRPWRTALVVLMVMVPSAGMAFGVVMTETNRWTDLDQLESTSGQADAFGEWYDQGTPAEADAAQIEVLRAALPDGSELVQERSYGDRISVGDARYYLQMRDLDLASPMADGRVDSLDGRAATSADEVVVSDDLAEELRLSVGDTVRPDRLDRDLEVVGIATFRGNDQHLGYVGAPFDIEELRALGANAMTTTLIDLPGHPFLDVEDPWSQQALAEPPAGWQIQPNTMGNESSVAVSLFWTYVAGGVALVVLGTVITAAFAISARRQLHVIGLLSASGAPPKTVQRLLVSQGALTGAVGAVIGIGLALIGASFIPPDLLRDMVGHHVDGIAIPVVQLLPILVIGSLGAAAASAIPARSAAHVSTLQALAGRRPLPVVPRRLPSFGVVSLLAGAAFFAMAVSGSRSGGSSLWALVAITGALATLAGVCMLAPWFVARLERWGGRWSQSWRLAGRSLARNRVRSSAVVGAICAIAATVVAGSTLWATEQTGQCCEGQLPYLQANQVVADSWVDTQTEVDPDEDGPLPPEPVFDGRQVPVDQGVIDAITAVLPEARMLALPTIEHGDATPGAVWSNDSGRIVFDDLQAEPTIGIATPEVLDLFDVPDQLRHELADGGAVALAPVPPDATSLTLDDDSQIELIGEVSSDEASARLPAAIVSPATADQLGLTTSAGSVLWSNPEPLTEDQRRQVELVRDDLWWELGESWDYVSGPVDDVARTELAVPADDPVDERLVRAAVLAAVLLVMLAVVAVGLALAAKDNEDERQVLAAVGAPPRTLRRVGALRAVLLVALAGAIALPAGLLPAAAIHAASTTDEWDQRTFAVDPSSLLFVVVLVPAVAGLLVWAAGGLRDLTRPTRPDTFGFGE
jgi:putative ABC transport system permease protein